MAHEGPTELKKIFAKPLVKQVDMNAEVSAEAVEIISLTIEKYQSSKNYEAAARTIKEQMDRKFGSTWHVCIGEGFGFEVTYQQRNLMYMFHGENLGILLYKC
eukprot:PLAT12360.2.p2 GENE.PLAT12360.2~~PLAT12360.2.p2  ORF type:complete len:103 (-),score=42.99 PLAT12360.2:68-376(-)